VITIHATIPLAFPPAWAVLERKLIDIMNESVYPFLQKYTREDGTIIWRDKYPNTRDGADDFYESFYNWPLFYLLGGGDHMLPLAHKEWDAVIKNMSAVTTSFTRVKAISIFIIFVWPILPIPAQSSALSVSPAFSLTKTLLRSTTTRNKKLSVPRIFR
jgi:hypothetical protein